MGIINFRIAGKPRILIVDFTNNEKQFEYRMSSELLAKLKGSGIALAADEVFRPTTNQEFAALFNRADLHFNVLLLIAHGGRDTSDAEASPVAMAGERSNWYELASLTSSLQDKLVCLAVCHGLCRDVIDAFVRDGEFALAIVAPMTSLSSSEVVAFFPPFFAELRDSSAQNIDPNDIRRILDNHNGRVHNKMQMVSDAVSR